MKLEIEQIGKISILKAPDDTYALRLIKENCVVKERVWAFKTEINEQEDGYPDVLLRPVLGDFLKGYAIEYDDVIFVGTSQECDFKIEINLYDIRVK